MRCDASRGIALAFVMLILCTNLAATARRNNYETIIFSGIAVVLYFVKLIATHTAFIDKKFSKFFESHSEVWRAFCILPEDCVQLHTDTI